MKSQTVTVLGRMRDAMASFGRLTDEGCGSTDGEIHSKTVSLHEVRGG